MYNIRDATDKEKKLKYLEYTNQENQTCICPVYKTLPHFSFKITKNYRVPCSRKHFFIFILLDLPIIGRVTATA